MQKKNAAALNPKPETLNQTPENPTLNPKPESPNPKSQTVHRRQDVEVKVCMDP